MSVKRRRGRGFILEGSGLSDEWPVGLVLLIIKATGITERVKSICSPPPKRSLGHPTVVTFLSMRTVRRRRGCLVFRTRRRCCCGGGGVEGCGRG